MSDSATPWTVTCQAPLSMGFLRQEYWTFSRGFPGSGIEPDSPALAGRFLTVEPPGKPHKVFGEKNKKGGDRSKRGCGIKQGFYLFSLKIDITCQKKSKNSVIKESLTYPFSRPVIFKLFSTKGWISESILQSLQKAKQASILTKKVTQM